MAQNEPGSSIDDNAAKPEKNPEENLSKPDSVPKDKISFWCTECGQKYILPKELSGKTGVCFKCYNYMLIPSESQKEPAVNKTIIFPCKYCGKKIRKLRKLVGTKVKCGECGLKNTVPEKSQISSLAKDGAVPEDRILFWCDYCGQKYRLPGHLAGKSGNCDRCHNNFIIPQKSQDKPRIKKTIVFPCVHCGTRQWKGTDLIGKEVECHKCGAKNIVPENRDVSLLMKKDDLILFWCGHCGQKYRLPREMGGKTGVCDVCHNDMHIPVESQTKPERKETIVFPCEYCGVKLRKSKESAGSKTHCLSCGRELVVPEKSKRSLIEIIAPGKNPDLFATEATKMNLYIPPQKQASSKIAKLKAEETEKTEPSEKKLEPPEKKFKPPEKKPGPREVPVKIISPVKKDREPDDKILFWCGYCGQKYRLPKEYAGKKSSCDVCQNDFIIPAESQVKPEKIKDALVFHCKNCGKKQWRPRKLAETQTACTECGEENTIPAASKTSLLEKVTPVKLRDAFIVTEATRTDLVVVGRPVAQKRKPSEKEQSAAKFTRPDYSEEDILETHLETHLGHPAAQAEPEIIITEDPPMMHKIKNYFQQKAEKYLIFAILVVFMDYLIDAYGDGKRPSKTFILFATFTTSAIILLGAWNYATYQPPDKTSKCRYNVVCTNPKCKYRGIIRSEKVIEAKCPKCGSALGLAYRCRECGKSFVYDEIASKKELRAHNFRIAKRKAKWHGGRPKLEKTMANSRVVKKCPECRSEDVYYVTVKQAEKEAAEKEAKAEMEKLAKKNARKAVQKNRKKKKKKKK